MKKFQVTLGWSREDNIETELSVKLGRNPDLERVLTVIWNSDQASLISVSLSMVASSYGLHQWAHLGNRRMVRVMM